MSTHTERPQRLTQLEEISDAHDVGCLFLSLFKVAYEIHPALPVTVPLPEYPIVPGELNHLFDEFLKTENKYAATYHNLSHAALKLNLSIDRIGVFKKDEMLIIPDILKSRARIFEVSEKMDKIIPSIFLFQKYSWQYVFRHAEAATHVPNDMERINGKLQNGWELNAVVTFVTVTSTV